MKHLDADKVSRPDLPERLGDLEWRILEMLWSRSTPATVGDALPACPGRAYTTVMTTMDRLFQKGFLNRRKTLRAYEYWPVRTRAQWVADSCAASMRWALGRATRPDDVGALLSGLTDVFVRHDPALLDALDALIRTHRVALDANASTEESPADPRSGGAVSDVRSPEEK